MSDAAIVLAQAFRLLERERTQEHGVHDAEDGRVRTDAKREHGDDGERERRRSAQNAHGISEVRGEGTHDWVSFRDMHRRA